MDYIADDFQTLVLSTPLETREICILLLYLG
jgi:hypothetical protein